MVTGGVVGGCVVVTGGAVVVVSGGVLVSGGWVVVGGVVVGVVVTGGVVVVVAGGVVVAVVVGDVVVSGGWVVVACVVVVGLDPEQAAATGKTTRSSTRKRPVSIRYIMERLSTCRYTFFVQPRIRCLIIYAKISLVNRFSGITVICNRFVIVPGSM